MSNFVDECGLNVKGGDGGAGCISFRREAHTPRGGPDGGDGGKGGDVWLVADRNVASLLSFRDHPHRKAKSGTHGSGKAKHGHSGEDLEVAVPEGTVVRDYGGEVLVDLVEHGDRWLAAEGGLGGKGNAKFLSNRRRAPTFAEQGEGGQEQWLRLELKLLADVALVGYPNVGKSTLISRISAAKPRIADYPFTTLEPNLGVVRYDDVEMTVADIPGLIKGASEGRGLGHQFLRHVERARVLVLLIDLADHLAPPASEQVEILLRELGDYQPDLLDRPRLIIGSRIDMASDTTSTHRDGVELDLLSSSMTGQGLDNLVPRMARLVRQAREAEPESTTFMVFRPEPEGYRIERADDAAYVVTGREAERAVALSDLTNPDALNFAWERLRQLGVDRALVRAGVDEGDVVRIGAFEFDWEEDL
ncbi:MAG: GTPase ObgE [Actinomycetia bacterium]|nr:GTPase ObgE [Actinomycetes bacterium]MCP4087966.1 GTPase ObgE [Actinomycetes bacterium]